MNIWEQTVNIAILPTLPFKDGEKDKRDAYVASVEHDILISYFAHWLKWAAKLPNDPEALGVLTPEDLA